MASIEKQIKTEEIKLPEFSIVTDEKQESPVVITLVQGQSGTLYQNESRGNGIPDRILV